MGKKVRQSLPAVLSRNPAFSGLSPLMREALLKNNGLWQVKKGRTLVGVYESPEKARAEAKRTRESIRRMNLHSSQEIQRIARSIRVSSLKVRF